MEETETQETEEPKKSSKLPLIIGLVLAVLGGGGGFYAVYSGLILGDSADMAEAADPEPEVDAEVPPVAFVPVDPVVISVAAGGETRLLRFAAQLEVPKDARSKVETLLPRVVDVFNSYLRAVEIADLEDPTALIRIRSHLLRRAQLVLGDDAVSNLLIMEFVLN